MMNSTTSSLTMLEPGTFERPRYFARQLMTPLELNLEHEYWRAKFRRHNLMLHGWGVVCGALVCPVKKTDGSGYKEWTVAVQPGYILGPCGDEILIDCLRTVDLRSDGITGLCGDPTGQPADPWCQEVFVGDREAPATLYVAVKYKEVMARPVRVQPSGCGCDDNSCEFSRWRDAYEIKPLTYCPTERHAPTHDAPTAEPYVEVDGAWTVTLASTGTNPAPSNRPVVHLSPVRGCPVCEDPWIVLAQVRVGADGTIQSIDNCACRRNVVSLAASYWTCVSALPKITAVDPGGTLIQGQKDWVGFTVTGENFGSNPTVDMGQGITISPDIKVDNGQTITFKARAEANAVPGPRTLRIVNPDCGTAYWDQPIQVEPKQTAAIVSSAPAKKSARSKPIT